MATICEKCGGIIPDIMFHFNDINDCKNHIKPTLNISYENIHSKEQINKYINEFLSFRDD